ncbi:uncharacterized protein Tco_0985413 [Tanacetum coccineum]
MTGERIKENNVCNVKLRLVEKREKDRREYNLPTANEVAAIIIGDFDDIGRARDIIVEGTSGKPQRISELHPSYLPLQYPLLFPYAEDGYRDKIFLKGKIIKTKNGRWRLSMREWFAYRMQQRDNETSLILMSHRLYQQFIVDAFTMGENDRLSFIRKNQKILRITPINNLNKSLEAGNSDALKTGNPIVLPSTYTGGTRYKMQNYLDAMALCKAFGYPDLFITFTCNPKWPEINRFVQKHNVSAKVTPGVLTRVFKQKLDQLIHCLRKKHILGVVNAVVYTVEFQKRGLPHVHICVFFAKESKIPNPEDIDRLISAEIPDEQQDPELYKLVSEQMMHGPCGPHNMSSTCMKKKRPDNTRTVVKNGVHLDNRYVVPYNPLLMKKFQAHINVEWCNQSGAIKYLFKYINKGQDRVTLAFEKEKSSDNPPKRKDEIKEYYDCRYISACEAAWRLYKFPIHYQYPPVQRLSFHLPDEQPIVFEDDEDVEDVLSKPSVNNSQFLQWMEINKTDTLAQTLTYVEFPKYFVWNKKTRKWTRRKKGSAVGRINYVPRSIGEAFFLRILLNQKKGPRGYEHLKTHNKKEYATFQDTCYAMGLLENDKEYIESIKEAHKYEVMESVIGCPTSKQVWTHLILNFEGPSKENRSQNFNHVRDLDLDIQDGPNDIEDVRSSQEYLNDLNEEFQEGALLANSKRFFRKELI